MASQENSVPPWRLGTTHDSLSRFTSLLGTFSLKNNAKEAPQLVQEALIPKYDALTKLLSTQSEPPLSFPSLSLVTEQLHEPQNLNKQQVEARAALNLSRSLSVMSPSKKPGHSGTYEASSSDASGFKEESRPLKCDQDGEQVTNQLGSLFCVTEVPPTMMANLVASFSLLVDARLRAYITILARHGVSLAESPEVPSAHKDEAIHAVERKLASLMDIGSRISIENSVTNFAPKCKLAMSRCVDEKTDEIMMPLVMSAVLDINVPRLDSGSERVTVSLQAAGAVSGTCAKGSRLLESVHMELNTHQLMSAMVQKAAKVSSIALDHVNDVHNVSHVEHPKMPPPPPKRKCHEVASLPDMYLPVVSPDLSAMLTPKRPTPLKLDDDSPLSPECCANIVDFVIGEINDDFMCPNKRQKLEHSH